MIDDRINKSARSAVRNDGMHSGFSLHIGPVVAHCRRSKPGSIGGAHASARSDLIVTLFSCDRRIGYNARHERRSASQTLLVSNYTRSVGDRDADRRMPPLAVGAVPVVRLQRAQGLDRVNRHGRGGFIGASDVACVRRLPASPVAVSVLDSFTPGSDCRRRHPQQLVSKRYEEGERTTRSGNRDHRPRRFGPL